MATCSRSSGLISAFAATLAAWASIARWVSIAPFGKPVVPDV